MSRLPSTRQGWEWEQLSAIRQHTPAAGAWSGARAQLGLCHRRGELLAAAAAPRLPPAEAGWDGGHSPGHGGHERVPRFLRGPEECREGRVCSELWGGIVVPRLVASFEMPFLALRDRNDVSEGVRSAGTDTHPPPPKALRPRRLRGHVSSLLPGRGNAGSARPTVPTRGPGEVGRRRRRRRLRARPRAGARPLQPRRFDGRGGRSPAPGTRLRPGDPRRPAGVPSARGCRTFAPPPRIAKARRAAAGPGARPARSLPLRLQRRGEGTGPPPAAPAPPARARPPSLP